MTGIEKGALPPSWPHAAADCTGFPEFRLHRYNDDLFILRQSGCSHFEKPFLYLIFGRERALLLDTGAGTANVRAAVDGAVDSWLARQGRASIELVVAHTHGHEDHIAGDAQFTGRPDTIFVPPHLPDVKRFYGFGSWPDDIVQDDLGERILDVIAIPGHEESSVAIYDRRTALLLTGDTLYAGRLYVEDGQAFTRSIQRLMEFTRNRPVAHILGCHIENSSTPYVDYPAGTRFQPEEHALELEPAHLSELNDALQQMKGEVTRRVMRDFTIWPVERKNKDEDAAQRK